MAASARCRASAICAVSLLLQLLVDLFLRLVELGARGAHGGLVLAGLGGGARQALFGGLRAPSVAS